MVKTVPVMPKIIKHVRYHVRRLKVCQVSPILICLVFLQNFNFFFSLDLGTIEDFVEEINSAKATAEPSINDSENCFTLNVNGDCLDHLDYSKGKLFNPSSANQLNSR